MEVSWNWFQLMHCAYLQSRPGYFKQRLQIEFLECARMEEVYWSDSEYECEDESNGDSEFRDRRYVECTGMHQNMNRAYWKSS